MIPPQLTTVDAGIGEFIAELKANCVSEISVSLIVASIVLKRDQTVDKLLKTAFGDYAAIERMAEAMLARTQADVGGDVTNLYATTSDGEFGDLISEDGDTSFHQYDAQADTNALLDNTGAVQAQYRYYAFGNVSELNLEGAGWNTMTQADWESLPLDLSSHMLAGGKKQYYLDMETALYLLGCGTRVQRPQSFTVRR